MDELKKSMDDLDKAHWAHRIGMTQRKWKRLMESDGDFAIAGEMICDHYCKYPEIYDEEVEGVPLAESNICKECPLGG